MTTTFSGRERIGVELCGTIPKEAANECAGGGLHVDGRTGAVPVSLVLLGLDDVHAQSFAAVKLSYVQALWRVGVIIRDKASWLVFRVDVDKALARLAAGVAMSYPTRKAAVHLKDDARNLDLVVAAEGKTLLVRAETHTSTPSRAQDKKRMIVRHGPRFYEVPWSHDAPKTRMAAAAKVSVQDLAEVTFGHGVAWDEEAVVWKDRSHGCGRAIYLPML